MSPRAQTAMTFATTVLVVSFVVTTFCVRGLGLLASAWGRGPNVLVLWWTSVGAALAAAAGCGLGLWLGRLDRVVSRAAVVTSATFYVLVTLAAVWLMARANAPPVTALIWLILVPAVTGSILAWRSRAAGGSDA